MNEQEKLALVWDVRIQYLSDLLKTVTFVFIGSVAFKLGTNIGIMDSIAYGSLTLLVYGVIGKGIEALTIRKVLDKVRKDEI